MTTYNVRIRDRYDLDETYTIEAGSADAAETLAWEQFDIDYLGDHEHQPTSNPLSIEATEAPA